MKLEFFSRYFGKLIKY